MLIFTNNTLISYFRYLFNNEIFIPKLVRNQFIKYNIFYFVEYYF